MPSDLVMRAMLAALLLAVAAGCASTETRQSAGEYIDDAVVTTKVKTALFKDDTVEGLDIAVETYRGVVQLSGFVESREDRRRAEEIARSVAGVKRVQNDLRLKSEQ